MKAMQNIGAVDLLRGESNRSIAVNRRSHPGAPARFAGGFLFSALDIQPIETVWKGYRFRSRLEARWAVVFTTLGVEWVYEDQGFNLPCGRYLPDFWIPASFLFLEIKPTKPDWLESKKCQNLADASGHHVALIAGQPWLGEHNVRVYRAGEKPLYGGAVATDENGGGLCVFSPRWDLMPPGVTRCDHDSRQLVEAFTKARGERFNERASCNT